MVVLTAGCRSDMQQLSAYFEHLHEMLNCHLSVHLLTCVHTACVLAGTSCLPDIALQSGRLTLPGQQDTAAPAHPAKQAPQEGQRAAPFEDACDATAAANPLPGARTPLVLACECAPGGCAAGSSSSYNKGISSSMITTTAGQRAETRQQLV